MTEAVVLNELGIAFHEAGHVIAAYFGGLAFYSVTIEKNATELGSAEIENPFHSWQRGNGPRRDALRKHLVGLLSGPAALSLHTGRVSEINGGDEEAAWHWLEHLPPPQCSFVGDDVWNAYLHKMRRHVRKIMQEKWPFVERLAGVLVERRTMNREEIVSVLEGKPKEQD